MPSCLNYRKRKQNTYNLSRMISFQLHIWLPFNPHELENWRQEISFAEMLTHINEINRMCISFNRKLITWNWSFRLSWNISRGTALECMVRAHHFISHIKLRLNSTERQRARSRFKMGVLNVYLHWEKANARATLFSDFCRCLMWTLLNSLWTYLLEALSLSLQYERTLSKGSTAWY